MEKLIEQYVERFHENFPLFALMGMDEAEIEKSSRMPLKMAFPILPPNRTGKTPYIKTAYR